MMMDKVYNSDESEDGETFSSQSQTQRIHIQGPNVSNFNLLKLPIGNNGRPRYAESFCDQRSSSRYKRDTSPMSVYSTASLQHRNLQQSMYRGTMSSHQSMYSGRFGSSASVRSFGSNVTLRSDDIIEAINRGDISKREWRKVSEAYIKYERKRSRQRIEKRRNKTFLLKRARRRSSSDLGEQGDESSGSSDDARSVRTCITAIPDNKSSSSCRSARTDYTDFRKNLQKTNLYKDRTNSFKQNSFRSLISATPKYIEQTINNHQPTTTVQRTEQYPVLKERFRSGILLPSQKFNQSHASSLIAEQPHIQNTTEHGTHESYKSRNATKNHQHESGSESEDIFSANTTVEKNVAKSNGLQHKRNFNHSDDDLPQKKRNKLSSSPKMTTNERSEKGNEPKTSDFVFAKPQVPLRNVFAKAQLPLKNAFAKAQLPLKNAFAKPQLPLRPIVKESCKPVQSNEKSKQNYQPPKKTVPESNQIPAKDPTTKTSAIEKLTINSKSPPKTVLSPESQPAEQLIAMSSQPLDDVMVPNPEQTQKNLSDNIDQSESQFSTTDMSMKPSFIKRKLFTQKADIAENKNSSIDTIKENSNHTNIYSMIQKEKNRTRKLVTSQSCLNRDLGDESNLLDLIHKIVPADQMNLTSATNRTATRSNKSKPVNMTSHEWDVSLAMKKCNKDEESDTYTDEEIFNTNETTVNSKTNNTHTAATEKERHIANKLKPPIAPVKPPTENQSIQNRNGNKPGLQMAGTRQDKPNQIANKLNSPIHQVESSQGNQDIHKIRAMRCIKSFWYSDDESDAETVIIPEKTMTSVTNNENCSRPNEEANGKSTKESKPPPQKKRVQSTKESKSPPQKKEVQSTKESKPPPQKKRVQSTKESKSPPQKKEVQSTKESKSPPQKKQVQSTKESKSPPQKKEVQSTKESKSPPQKKEVQSTKESKSPPQKKQVQSTKESKSPPQKKEVQSTKESKSPPQKKQVQSTKVSKSPLQKQQVQSTKESKCPPQTKQVQGTKNKQLGNSENPTVKEKETAEDSAINKIQQKRKINENLKLNNVVSKNRNVTKRNQNNTHTFEKVLNNTRTLRVHSKLKCGDVPANNIVDNTIPLTRSLRNRDIDLSTTASSGMDTTLKDVPKPTVRPRQNVGRTKPVENKENVSNLSDSSFTLQVDKTIMTRRMKSKLNEILCENTKSPSDVSFSLVTDNKKKNNTGITERAAKRSRNISKTVHIEVTKQKRMPIK